MITAPNAPMARAQDTASAMARPGAASGSVTRRNTRRGRSPEQRRLLLQPGVDGAERGLRAQHVIRGRLVDLGDDQGQERVGGRQVQAARCTSPIGRERADHEDQHQADDQRRQQQAAQHPGLPHPRERQRAAGQHPGQRGRHQEQHGHASRRPTPARSTSGSSAPGAVSELAISCGDSVGQQGDHRAEQGDPDHARADHRGDARRGPDPPRGAGRAARRRARPAAAPCRTAPPETGAGLAAQLTLHRGRDRAGGPDRGRRQQGEAARLVHRQAGRRQRVLDERDRRRGGLADDRDVDDLRASLTSWSACRLDVMVTVALAYWAASAKSPRLIAAGSAM